MALNYAMIGKKIKEVRQHRKLSQLELSEMADISPTFLSYIETGSKRLSIDTLVQIANALQVTPAVLLENVLDVKEPALNEEFSIIFEDCTIVELRVLLELNRGLIEVIKKNNVSFSPYN
jgi:transcriptional regulator with XRE-family HTH domain